MKLVHGIGWATMTSINRVFDRQGVMSMDISLGLAWVIRKNRVHVPAEKII